MRLRCDARDGSVWRVRLEPGSKGEVAFDGAGLEQLDRLLQDADESRRCRVLVIESNPGVFCKGMDLEFLVAHAGEDQSEKLLAYARCMDRLRGSSKAVICLIDGEAMGGGVGLAAAADVVIATSRSVFALPECVLGLIPAMVLPLLCERMPVQKARWMALSSRGVKAEEALSIGLVDELVEGPIQLEQALRRNLKRLLRAGPRAVARLKRYSSEIAPMGRSEALELGAEQTAKDLLELETIAAIRGFMSGESPVWFERYRPGGGGRGK
ncbi:enoyl-CoA hydratase/isomerase family protein [Pseudenhygromyxa sp. WMMC2535]|uniref:enoyl-CoA hydratase/isomerase family protein n=1 Tax=Pseudenhygromyxa sp. WMMC2535 TaxID=2712867 RepID=UPI001557CCF5|nr:enoyl-CoA hydratase/isomerase family protein [Pseudenhygromyxa sp. WMMC2535]NVB38687.1 enoyl-CoA hydratase/isomerase family protein [Pseudenhygromyxa sp. WMMC2535]